MSTAPENQAPQAAKPQATRPFAQVDVFTGTAYLGNPLAVVLDGAGLSDAQMQQFAHWTNLSETTFIMPPSPQAAAQGADYRVRIFTPRGELPFAGHPTLGSCHAWLEQHAGQADATATKIAAKEFIVQECKSGLIRIRREGARLAFAAPPLQRSNPSPALLARVAAALGLKADQIIAAQMLDNGPVWLGLLLDSRQTVLNLTPDLAALRPLVPGVGVASVNVAHAPGQLIARSNREARAFGAAAPQIETTPELEVRFFAPDCGIDEDPVTGGFNASLAQWLIAEGHAPTEYVAAQGTCIGRAGRVHIAQDREGQVWVGGESVTCVKGQVVL